MNDLALVVPCFNESHRLELRSFAEFASANPGIRFWFVDDGSTDGTGRLLARFCRGDPAAFRLVRLPANRGKAEAVRCGVLAAFSSEPRYVGFWDADLATPLEALRGFVEILDARPAVELVMGARVQLLGRSIERRALRHYLGRVFATAVSLMLALRVYDTQCGAKLFRASPAIRTLFATPFRSRWLFDVELLARLQRMHDAGDRRSLEESVYELPLTSWRDVAGSKLRVLDLALAPGELGRIYWAYRAPWGINGSRGILRRGTSGTMPVPGGDPAAAEAVNPRPE